LRAKPGAGIITSKWGIYLKLRYLVIVLSAFATPAWARIDPTPPPSGIVVHLFGPGGVMGNVLPTAPDAKPVPGAPAPGMPAAAYPEPSLGDVLHQMFVTGDPNQQVRPWRRGGWATG
jgi:hypothetical protein